MASEAGVRKNGTDITIEVDVRLFDFVTENGLRTHAQQDASDETASTTRT
jgi:hypothetical protein